DGKKVQEIVLHDTNGPKTIYKVQRCKSPRTEHPINQIFQVLPCGGDDLVDDILPDLMDDGQTGMKLTGTKITSPELTALLKKREFLSRGLGDACDQVMHRIYVDQGTKPVSAPPRRLPVKYLTKAEESIKEMRDQDIIEDSKSPWCSNIVP